MLRAPGLIRMRGMGQRRIYSLNLAAFDEIEDWLAECRRIWRASHQAAAAAERGGLGSEAAACRARALAGEALGLPRKRIGPPWRLALRLAPRARVGRLIRSPLGRSAG